MKIFKIAVTLTLGLIPVVVSGQDEFEEVRVLENAKYSLTNRLVVDADFSFLPLDAYYKPLLVEGALTYQFADLFAWEIARFGYSLVNYDTKLKSSINSQLSRVVNADGSSPQVSENDLRLNDFRYRASSTLFLNMLYSKSNFFNRSIAYYYWQVGLGGSYYNMKSKYQTGLDFVVRVRFFFDEHWSMTLRGGQTIGFLSDVPKNILFLGLGAAFAF